MYNNLSVTQNQGLNFCRLFLRNHQLLSDDEMDLVACFQPLTMNVRGSRPAFVKLVKKNLQSILTVMAYIITLPESLHSIADQ